jgi:hypothetical protein
LRVLLSAFELQQKVTKVQFISGVNMKTRFSSQRLLFVVAQLTAVTVYTSYAAFLISFLAVQKFSLPFNSLRELIDIGSFRLGVLANSGQLNNFNVSPMAQRQWFPSVSDPCTIKKQWVFQGLVPSLSRFV